MIALKTLKNFRNEFNNKFLEEYNKNPEEVRSNEILFNLSNQSSNFLIMDTYIMSLNKPLLQQKNNA